MKRELRSPLPSILEKMITVSEPEKPVFLENLFINFNWKQ